MKKFNVRIILFSFAFFLSWSLALAQDTQVCDQDYIVQAGDFLGQIAQDRYGKTALFAEIVAATNAQAQRDPSYATLDDPAYLEIGWKLCLPNLAPRPTQSISALQQGERIVYLNAPNPPLDLQVALKVQKRTVMTYLTPKPRSTSQPLATPPPSSSAQQAPADVAVPTVEPPRPPVSNQTTSVNPAWPAASSFAFGIQVDDDGDAALNIAHMQTLGLRWVKIQMPWKEVEPHPGNYQWGHWDNFVNAYHGAGIRILLSIPKAPDWARPADDDKSVEGPPSDPQVYANFVGQVATRYAGRVQAIEIWNEQNLYYEAGGQGRVKVDQYMALLTAAYRTIKAVNPDLIVVSGAPTPTGAPPPLAVDDILYLRQMYEQGLKHVSDAIGAHPSGFANAPDIFFTGGDYDPNRGYDDHRSFFYRNTMEAYRQLMLEFGDGNKAVWPTEFGWPVWRYWGDARFEFAKDNTLEEQAWYIQRAFELGREWGWVGPMFLWNLDYAITAPETELANFSIITRQGVTPAYEALRAMPK